jgi:uncharacterized membrane protein YeaQ/YmgE (transglycosylase-associated protein family)
VQHFYFIRLSIQSNNHSPEPRSILSAVNKKRKQIMDQMGWLAWSIVGATAGWLASKVMKTSRQQGLLMNIVVGILGAFWCGFLFQQFGATGTTGFNIWSLFVAFVGAVVLLVVIRLLTGRLKFLPKQQRTTRLW